MEIYFEMCAKYPPVTIQIVPRISEMLKPCRIEPHRIDNLANKAVGESS